MLFDKRYHKFDTSRDLCWTSTWFSWRPHTLYTHTWPHTATSINEIQQLGRTPMPHVNGCECTLNFFLLSGKNQCFMKVSECLPLALSPTKTVYLPLNRPASLHYSSLLPTSFFLPPLNEHPLSLWSLSISASCIMDDFGVWTWVSSFSTVSRRLALSLSFSFAVFPLRPTVMSH